MEPMERRSEAFGKLLTGAINSIASYESRTARNIEDELGDEMGVSGTMIQRYKAGHIPSQMKRVEILARAAVKRGYLNREWLQRFLHAVRHPNPDKLLDDLCPTGPARPRPARVYHNLPAPTYSQFVMREKVYAQVLEGLRLRSAVVPIVGLGGTGKTSLAREMAGHCLDADSDAPQFDAVVWVSDKDRPGTTNLSIVLDEIAHTLDYPGFAQYAHEEKRREVEQALRRQKVLLVVDSFETMTDQALLDWLVRLPEPSKALITTREYREEIQRNCWPVELSGMTEAEAQELIHPRLRALGIDIRMSKPSELAPLMAATGGNPKAIELTLGLLKYGGRSFPQLINDLRGARGDLFDDLFARCWALLDEAARRVLLSATLFSASASMEALAATADVQGFAFDRAVEQLTELALLTRQTDLISMPRYTLHPLVRAFAGARLDEWSEFERGARERWVGLYLAFLSGAEFAASWNALDKLKALDLEQETIFAVITWAAEHQLYAETLQLAKGSEYYYYVRGLWDKKLAVSMMYADAARNLGDRLEEIEALAFFVQLLSRQGNLAAADKYLPRLHELAQAPPLSGASYFYYKHTIATYWMARGELNLAQQTWQESLQHTNELPHLYASNIQWLATCLYQKGELVEAQKRYRESLELSRKHGYQRYIALNQLMLAAIDLDQGNLADAAAALEEAREVAEQHQDREHLARSERLSARLHILRGEHLAARAALTAAIDLFERLGLRQELIEARAALADLEISGGSGTDGTMVKAASA
jgi:tetratricopeptide (TPR) repeat protein